VREAHFNDIRYLAGSSISMPVEDSIPAATILYNTGTSVDRYGDFHINIDCPDHYTCDVWSMIYAYDTSSLYAETKTPGGTFANTLLTNYLTTANRWPAVVYNNTGTAINFGWWSRRGGGYIATKLSNDGTTFFTGTPSGTYKVIDYITGIPYKKLSFSKQNDRTNRLFVQSGMGPYFDLRSKLANWTTTSFRPENPTNTDDLSIDDGRLEVAPNPFGQSFQLISDAPSSETFDVVVTDTQGKTVHTAKGNLADINRSFEIFGTQAASGMYFISTLSSSKNYDRLIKIVKK
jgi:hypothetical protein